MNDAVQLISDLFKQEVANQVEAKVINAANVKLLQAQNKAKDKEIEQLRLEIEALKTDVTVLKQQIEEADKPAVVEVVDEQ